MRSFTIPILLATIAALGLDVPDMEAAESETFFAVTGDVTVSVDEATATMTKIRGRIPPLCQCR